MSLINDALNELDKRNAGPANEDRFLCLDVGARSRKHEEVDAASAHQNSVSATIPYSLRSDQGYVKKPSNTLYVTVFILFILSAITTSYLFLDRLNRNKLTDLVDTLDKPSLVMPKSSDDINVERALVGSFITALEPKAPKTTKPDKLERKKQALENNSEQNSPRFESLLSHDKDQRVGSSSVVENSLRLDLLLLQADHALLRQRLTTPKQNNAVDLYSAALALDANNQRALQGLEDVKTTYLKLIDTAYKNGRESTAQNLQQRLSGFISGPERARIAKVVDTLKLKYSALAKNYKIIEDSKPVGAKKNGDTDRLGENYEVISVAAIEKSSEQLVLDAIAEYKRLMVQGRINEAETLLTNVLDDNTVSGVIKNSQISPVIFEHYIQAKNISAAKNWLDIQSAAGNSVVFERAKLIDLSEDNAAALAFLDAQLLTEPRAMAMYAALLSKFNRFGESASTYRNLLQINEVDARYWLGLAVAEDKTGRSNAALYAYRKSQLIGGHQESVDDFIAKRIAVLERDGNKGNTKGSKSEYSQSSMELSQW